jgi:uncharacterized protein
MTTTIQRCRQCGRANYPARSLCRNCLSDDLFDSEEPLAGRLLATTTVYRTLDPSFQAELPLRIGTVLLDVGPRVMSFLSADTRVGQRVSIDLRRGTRGELVFEARPERPSREYGHA